MNLMNIKKNLKAIIAFSLFILTLWPLSSVSAQKTKNEVAYFAGGCFWCTESDLEKITGVIEVQSGYSGGDEVNPTYEQVSSGKTKHIESVKVIYDPEIINYQTLVQKFLLTVDVTDSKGQFVDKGPQYISAIFYQTDSQQQIIAEVFKLLNAGKPFKEEVATQVLKFKNFIRLKIIIKIITKKINLNTIFIAVVLAAIAD